MGKVVWEEGAKKVGMEGEKSDEISRNYLGFFVRSAVCLDCGGLAWGDWGIPLYSAVTLFMACGVKQSKEGIPLRAKTSLRHGSI